MVGNPSLRPERVEGWDAGGAWSGSTRTGIGAEVEWAHFESIAHDLIIYWPFNASSSRASNISRATIRGEEVSLRLGGPLGLSARGSFTRQTALDRGPLSFWHGKRLPEQPGREAYARLDWARGALRASRDRRQLPGPLQPLPGREPHPGWRIALGGGSAGGAESDRRGQEPRRQPHLRRGRLSASRPQRLRFLPGSPRRGPRGGGEGSSMSHRSPPRACRRRSALVTHPGRAARCGAAPHPIDRGGIRCRLDC